jgi:hypothetical protein
MKVVEMVLEAHGFTRDGIRVEDSCHQPTALFLCRESLRQYVHACWHHEYRTFSVRNNSVRFLGVGLWPADNTIVEVSGINQRNGASGWFRSQPLAGAKIHDTPGAHTQPQFVKRAWQHPHCFSQCVSIVIWNEMNKRLRIVGSHDVFKWDVAFYSDRIIRCPAL